LCGSCTGAFISSHHFRPEKKFNMVDIQNATLAGGVAVGAIADMVLYPIGALAIGLISGILSVVGYVYVQPFLETKIGLYDTCGVHNLHGMPGVMSGITSAIVAAVATKENYKADLLNLYAERVTRSATEQGGAQIAFLFITLAIAITSGYITGHLLKYDVFEPLKTFFSDVTSWEVPEMEIPYFHDKRGEIGHSGGHAKDSLGKKEIEDLIDSRAVKRPSLELASSSSVSQPPTQYQSIVDRLDIIMSALTMRRVSPQVEQSMA